MKICIGLVVKRDDRAQEKARELERWLVNRDVDVVFVDNTTQFGQIAGLLCLIVLGGDGTFLSAARLVGCNTVPLMGVKFGEVGFLAETLEDHLFEAALAVLDNRFTIEERMRLNVTVERDGQIISCVDVLNDLVLTKGALSRLAYCGVEINGNYLTTYKADGLIVATPTGSTGYSLAAGGPVIHPAVPGIILTPICPFTLTNRPLIIPEASQVVLELDGDPTDIVLTFDGQEGMDITGRDRIIVKKSDNPIRMISLSDQNYFKVLKARLMWSGGRG